MNKIVGVLILAIIGLNYTNAQKRKTENVIIVTLDGMRWQEVFKGFDSAIANNKTYNRSGIDLSEKFGASTVAESRAKIFPFIWNTIAKQGQIFGNRALGNNVNNANPYWFSYPGYNEILTGYPDTMVNSNDKINNKNINVLEVINQKPAFKGKVAAFATWDAFPFILNKSRSGVYVNADTDAFNFATPTLTLLNDMQYLTTRPIGVRPDVITYFAGREYLKTYKPRILYIAFDETDDFAHSGMYDQYLGSAFSEDAMIADLWKTVQSIPEYKDKTTLIITTDHGRGDKNKDQWKDHGREVEDAGQIWLAAIGPDTRPLGEMKVSSTLYQAQIAATVAALLGIDFKPGHLVYPPIAEIYK
jgi:hypothetical protein